MKKIIHVRSVVFWTISMTIIAAFSFVGCEKKEKLPKEETLWVNTLELNGVSLENTLTCRTDGTFSVVSATSVLGVPVSVDVAAGTFSGDVMSDGDVTFIVEKLAQEFSLFVPEESIAQPPITQDVVVTDGVLSIDIGIGRNLVFTRQ